MRNRQLIARWVYEKGAAEKVVELVKKDGKTYVVINDYEKVRDLFGRGMLKREAMAPISATRLTA